MAISEIEMSELLRVEGLTLTRNHKIICHNFSMHLNSGNFWGILGINGRGKTTLLHVLAGLIRTLTGRIVVEDRNILNLTRKQIAQKIGLLLQDESHQYPMTVQDTIENGRYARKKQLTDPAFLNAILCELNLLPYQDHNLLQLSGGEQRRVSIGRILFQQPNIYLLDEPTNHLDPVQKHIVLTHFKTLCTEQNSCVVMAGHSLDLMQIFCDHFLLLCEDGTTRIGTAKEILTPENLQRVYGIEDRSLAEISNI